MVIASYNSVKPIEINKLKNDAVSQMSITNKKENTVINREPIRDKI